MNLLIFTSLLCLLYAYITTTHGQTNCNGCANNDCYMLNDNIYGCYATFTAGTISSDALNSCASGYHLCESANEAEILGLTSAMCAGGVPTDHIFWTLESSTNSNFQCYSEYGSITDSRPSSDVWACKGGSNIFSGCNGAGCGPLNMGCGDSTLDYISNGFTLCGPSPGGTPAPTPFSGCEGTELFTMSSENSNTNGVLCCTDDLGFDPDFENMNCDDIIYVRSIETGPVAPSPSLGSNGDFSPYIGKYLYQGTDGNGYPIYRHTDSSAEISITTYQVYTLVSILIPSFAEFWAPTSIGTVTPSPSPNPGVYDLSTNEIFDGTDVTYSTLGGAGSLTVKAAFNDCQFQGFDFPEETTTTPPVPDECPNYNYTDYTNNGGCSGDSNCASCFNWGCSQCNLGYYKMGNNMRCQSCTDNYDAGCAQCFDWQGCTSCNNGYTFTWEPSCPAQYGTGDHICVAN